MEIAGKTEVVEEPGEPPIDVRQCACGNCHNRFWVQIVTGAKWQPSYCPFCAFQFQFLLIDGNPAVFNPK